MASTTFAATTADETVPIGFMAVLIIPGITTLTPTGASNESNSARSTSESPSTPCLATVYGPSRPNAMTAAIEAVLTTCPSSPDARMRGTKARIPWITPHRSMSITRCQSSRGISQE